VPRWQIDTLEITGGFLQGIDLNLPPGLTCVIGPRGSGKSTLVELVRFGVGGPGLVSRSSGDLVKHNLGAGMVTIRTTAPDGGESYLIRRSLRQAPSLTTAAGSPVTAIDLDRGTFFPLDAFSSAEIEEIANESLGAKRRSLLDDLRETDIQEILASIAQRRRELEANADRVTAARRLVADLTEQIEELGEAEARLAALPPPAPGDTPSGLTQAMRQEQANEVERERIAGIGRDLDQLHGRLIALAAELEGAGRRGLSIPDSLNAGLLGAAEERLAVALAGAGERLRTIADGVRTARAEFEAAIEGLPVIHTEQAAALAALKEQNQAAGEALRVRAAAEQAVSRLRSLREQRVGAEAELSELLTQRNALRSAYVMEREGITQLRASIAAELQAAAVEKVRVRVLSNADNLGYRQLLTEGLRGASLRNHDDILDKLLQIRPEHLAQIVHSADASELEIQSQLGKERCAKILAAFREKLDPFGLETLVIDDKISIELNVSTDGEPAYRDASELSRGQKCTAMLPLLLARRDSPLIIDQPEDNLDNRFIYETVVESVRRLKGRRQMIFVTHNANIPVLGGAELVIVLNSDGRRGFVEKIGGVDECRDHIIDLLEGGREAFELRRRRYAE
jgi:DNA repair exonuclease SbcCD ATPase subunit